MKNPLACTYDTAGQLTQITDLSLGQTTRYSYGLVGNRLSEQLWVKTLLPGTDAQTDVLYQDNHLAYCALNPLRVAGTGQANVSILYDDLNLAFLGAKLQSRQLMTCSHGQRLSGLKKMARGPVLARRSRP